MVEVRVTAAAYNRPRVKRKQGPRCSIDERVLERTTSVKL
jgi:hypothetical protein